MTLDLDFVREQFPALSNEWIFMDNAGGSQILKGCVANINEYYYANNVQLGGSYELSQAASRAFSEGREKISMLFNAKSADEIVFGPSTTVLLQFLSKSLASFFQPGDEVIVTSLDHESNIGPWLELEKIGVKIKFWELKENPYTLDLKDLEKRIGNITIAYTRDKKAIYAKDLNAHGPMTVLLKDAMRPNVTQTLENNPAIIHGGPFATIQHGCNSFIASTTGL